MYRSVLVYSILVMCLAYSVVHAQRVTGNLEGRVVNSDGSPLAAVNITVRGNDMQGVRGATTNAQGFFRVLALPVGNVTVTISHIAYHEIKHENVTIKLGKTTTLGEIRLTPKTIELQGVVVTSAQPAIDPNTTAISTNLTAEEFEALPTERDYLTITQLLPQANISFLGDDVNIAGATGQENAYFIDGMNTTEMYRGIGSSRLPYNFIKEIEVKSGGYEAEYGKATGGIVNVITYSGSNEFEAKAFGFFTDNRFADDRRRGFVDLNTGDFTKYDAGFSLGGPLVRDKLWFFTAYNGRVEKEDVTFDGLGVRSDKKTLNTFAGKLTWQASPKTNVMFSIFGDPSNRDRIATNSILPFSPSSLANPDPFLGTLKLGSINLALRGNHLFNNNFQLEAALSRYSAQQVAKAATEIGKKEPLLVDLTTGIWSGGYGEEFDRQTTRNSASVTGTYFWGSHTFKSGLQLEDNIFDEGWTWVSEGPDSAGQILKNSNTNYIALPLLPSDTDFTIRNRVISFFVQGSIALHPRLTANLGFRWDGQYVKGKETRITKNIIDQYQPRLGFVLQPGKLGTQKVSGSFGRFYEQIPSRGLYGFVGGLSQHIVFYDHNPLEDPTGGVRVQIARPEDVNIEKDLKGEHFDEFTLGYEREINDRFKFGIRGVYRILREIIQNADDPTTGAVQALTGNPGRGILKHMPNPERKYSALEITLEKHRGKHLNFLVSYVLSRAYGNYTGLFSSDTGLDIPNVGTQFDNPQQLVNATGLLPNDRTHVLKFNGSYRFDFGLNAGAFFLWQTGTPLSELGANPNPARRFSYSFLRKRGTVGRTPAIWDLNLRLTYELSQFLKTNFNQKLILDVFHLFSQRKAVNIEQAHFFAVDPNTGEQISENPNYLRPLLYQPPLTIRLGLEVGF